MSVRRIMYERCRRIVGGWCTIRRRVMMYDDSRREGGGGNEGVLLLCHDQTQSRHQLPSVHDVSFSLPAHTDFLFTICFSYWNAVWALLYPFRSS